MAQIQKTRERGQALTGSPIMFSGGNTSEYNPNPTQIQAARFSRRFAVSDAVARLLAEHCYAKGVLR